MVDLFCRTDGCNLHDFRINAGGVCAYLDFMVLQEQKITPPVIKPVEVVVTQEIEKPPPRYEPQIRKTQGSNGGGVPL